MNIYIHHYKKLNIAMSQLEMSRHSGKDLQTPIQFSDVH